MKGTLAAARLLLAISMGKEYGEARAREIPRKSME